MLERLLRFSVANRWLIVLFTLVIAAVGAFSLTKLPIDAVPDITNVQVQINTLFPALSPLEVEKQVTFPLETALAGIPGLQSTRSLSRNNPQRRRSAITGSMQSSGLPVMGLYLSEK